MKKLILLTLVLVFILSLAGCGKKAPKAMTFEEFDTKWKRADYAAFLADPAEFIDDLMAVSRMVYSADDMPTNNGWEPVAPDDTISFQKECVLFNQPFSYSASAWVSKKTSSGSVWLTVRLDSGDARKDLEFANAVYSTFVEKCGSPDEIIIDGENAKEPELLRILDGSSNPASFTAAFGYSTVSVYAFQHSDGRWSTSASVVALPDDLE